MKVLLINSQHNLGGGAHTVYLNTADMLKDAGIEVVFFAMHSNEEIGCEQSNFFPSSNTQDKPFRYVLNRFYNNEAANCLQKLLRKEHPDIAHVHLIWGGLAPSILEVLKRNGIPVVHTVHDYAMVCSLATLRSIKGDVCERCSDGHFFECIKTRCHRGSLFRSAIAATEIAIRNKKYHPINLISYFLFVSEFCLNKHCEMDSRFIKSHKSVLYNVPDLRVSKLSESRMPDTYNSYYLYYGRLSYEKGLLTLISAFRKRPELSLKILGKGPLEADLMKFCIENKVDNIEFLGFRTGDELYKIVREAKFVCVPSEWYENNPMTIVEAYTLSTPVIAAEIGGIPEIVNEGNTGFLFKSESVTDLLNAIDKCCNMSKDDYQEMKKATLRFSHEKFERVKYVDKLLKIYKETIKLYKGTSDNC